VRPDRSIAAASAAGLFVAWSLATYLLEGRVLTFARPDALADRAAYALIANLLIGIGGSALLLRWLVARSALSPEELGLRSARRTFFSIALASTLGAGILLPVVWSSASEASSPVSGILLANSFAQVLVVSIAEVLVCWAVLGTAIGYASAGTVSRAAPRVIAWLGAAAAFGVYHFAHSPPFDTLEMVGFLTLVGLATGAFYFTVRELYGTIVFHHLLAFKGVTSALAGAGPAALTAQIQPSIALTAVAAIVALVLADLSVRRIGRRRLVPRLGGH
jgi:hypothetical protein